MTHPALKVAHAIADLLAHPDTAPMSSSTASDHRQQLAYGPPGIALLHIERAASGLGPWQRAHDWLATATGQPLISGPDSHPFYGAPALAYVLASAAEHLPGPYCPYQRALNTLDQQMSSDIERRLGSAHRRIDAGVLPELAEFDAIRGLSGYGAYLLLRKPDSAALRSVLDYCVRLTEPLSHEGEFLPGWWVRTGPSGRPDHRFPGGHANTGVAHGIGGVLALLALAARHGTVVDGHHDAMRTILAWLDRWQQKTQHGTAWPYWVNRAELRAGRLSRFSPQRPSWCYGTAGLARAQQLASLALADAGHQVQAEHVLLAALTDPVQLNATTDNGLCHGFSGLAHIAARAADDAASSTAGKLRAVIPALLDAVRPPGTQPADAALAMAQAEEAGPGFLNGAAGIALALQAPAMDATPRTAWDTCLLIA